jgi:CBS domain-containing protein
MENNAGTKKTIDQVYYLTELLGVKVTAKSKKIGTFSDVVVRDGDIAAEVTHIVATRPLGDASLFIPWTQVKTFDKKEIVVDVDDPNKFAVEPSSDMILVKDYIIDKKILDMEGKEVEVAYDARMVIVTGKLFMSDVDISRYSLMSRMGLKWLLGLSGKKDRATIAWKYVQPLPSQLSSFKGNVKLKILKEKLSEIHPADLADILEELDPEQRVSVFRELETGHASDTLEEIDPGVQRAIVSALPKERIAQLVNEMTPGQAADVLAVLPSSEAKPILELLNKENAAKIQSILEKHEEKILNYATSYFLKFPPDITVHQAHELFRKNASISDVVMYIYVVDKTGKLLGVIDIRELMKANDDALLKDIMVDIVAALTPSSTLREASSMFTRYSFRAIPVVDEANKILGVVPYRDMMNLKHRYLE